MKRTRLSGILHAFFRVHLFLLLGVLGVFCIALGAIGLAIFTHPGRALLAQGAVSLANGMLPGSVELGEIERLDPSGVRLRQITVRDPSGDVVLQAEHLSVDYIWREIFDGRFILTDARVEKVWADLRTLQEERRGIIAAFVDPDAPPSPASPGPPPFVQIQRVTLTSSTVHLPELPSIGQLDLSRLELEGSFLLDKVPSARLKSARFEAQRHNQPIAVLERVEGNWMLDAPSSISLDLDLLSARLRLDARAVLPPEPHFLDGLLEGHVELKGLVAKDLSTLFDNPELLSTFDGALSVTAEISGSPRAPHLKADLTTEGGQIHIEGHAADFTRAEAQILAREFVLGRVRSDLPQEPIDLDGIVRVDARDLDALKLDVALREGRFGVRRTPTLTFAATLGENELRQITLELRESGSRLQARGRVGFDGDVELQSDFELGTNTLTTVGQIAKIPGGLRGRAEGRIHLHRTAKEYVSAQGSLSLKTLDTKDVKVDAANLDFNVRGTPPQLSGSLRLSAARVRFDDQSFEEVELQADGGPIRYHIEASARGADASGRGSIELELGPESYHVAGNVQGTLQSTELDVEIAPTRFFPQREALISEGLSVRIGERTLRLRGQVEPRRVDIEVESDGPMDLGQVSELFALDPPLSGHARISGRASGTTELPFIDVSATLQRVTLGDRPPIDGDFSVALDAAEGSLLFRGEVSASNRGPSGWKPLELRGEVEHHFRGGVGYERRLLRGRPEGRIELRALDLEFVEAWAGMELPVTGHLGANVEAGGSWQSPTLSLTLRSKLKVRGDPRVFDADGTLSLAEERWLTEWAVSDQEGEWLTVAAEAVTPAAGSKDDPFIPRLTSLPSQGRWQIQARAAKRQLSMLPLLNQSEEIPPAFLSGDIDFAHEPGEEPQGRAHLRLEQSERVATLGGCQGGDLRIAFGLDLADGKYRVRLIGRHHNTELFRSHAQGSLAIAPLLAGGPLELGPISAELGAYKVNLSTLPYLCAKARGTMDAEVRLTDPLGAHPELESTFRLRGFRASPLPTRASNRIEELIDVDLDLRAHARFAEARALVVAAGNRSTFDAKLPILFEKGSLSIAEDAPLDAHLHIVHLPISPLLDPRGSISYASGHIHGQIDLRGTRAEPRFDGELELERVAFTATDLAQPLRDVHGLLRFSERNAFLEGLEAKDGDGILHLDGQARFDRLDRIDADFRVRTESFPLRQMGQVVAELDLEADIETRVLPERTQVSIKIDKADMWIENANFRSGISLDAHPDFVVDGKRTSNNIAPNEGALLTNSKEPPEPQTAPHVTELKLESRERLWIKRDDFAVNLSARLQTEIVEGQANVKGDVLIERGYLTLLGKTFNLERGSKLSFIGGPTPDPVIDLTAVFDNRRTGDQVKVHITGRGSKPVIDFLINDKRGEAGDAFTAIYGSQGTNQSSQSAPSQAAGFVGGLTAGLLATSARKELGAAAPIIMIEPGEKAGEGRVRAGFELDSLVPVFLRNVITGVYVEGIVSRESSTNSRSASKSQAGVHYGVLLEFYYPKNFFSTAQYGPGSTWSLDLGWQL